MAPPTPSHDFLCRLLAHFPVPLVESRLSVVPCPSCEEFWEGWSEYVRIITSRKIDMYWILMWTFPKIGVQVIIQMGLSLTIQLLEYPHDHGKLPMYWSRHRHVASIQHPGRISSIFSRSPLRAARCNSVDRAGPLESSSSPAGDAGGVQRMWILCENGVSRYS